MNDLAATPRRSLRAWLPPPAWLGVFRPGEHEAGAGWRGEPAHPVSEAAARVQPEMAPDPQAVVATLYLRHAQAVLAYLYHRLPSLADAEDALADVFIAALRSCARGEVPGLPWLMVVARRRVADYYRDHHHVASLPAHGAHDDPTDPREGPEQSAMRAEERQEMLARIASLPDEQREALILRFGAGLRSQQIALILGKSDEATRALLSRALRRLREGWAQ